MSLRSRSPVFFTGCSDSSRNINDSILVPPHEELLSPEDYKNLSAALDSLFKNNEPPSCCVDLERTHCTQPKRPYLLPLPPAQQTTQNGFEKPCSDIPNCESLSSATSFDAEVHLTRKPREVPSMGADTISLKNSSPNAALPNVSSFETPRHERSYKRRFLLSAPSTPEDRFYSHPIQANSSALCSPETSDFRSIKRSHHYPHSQDFNPFSTPGSASYSAAPPLKRKSDPTFMNKRRRTLSPERLGVPEIRNSNPFLLMSDLMWQVYHNNKQSTEEQNHKFALRSHLHQTLREAFPRCGLYIVGSTMNGMGTKNCDMDLCLMLSHTEIDQGQEAITILKEVARTLSKCEFLKNQNLIRAKVPILKFKDTIRGIDVDLNINNAVGIRNTHLLNSYARLDQRVSPLVIIIKLWARTYDINDAKTNTLSSYSLALMIIHYLQFICDPPVVPCLQHLHPCKYHPDSDVTKLKLEEDLPAFVSQNGQTLGELFFGFLNYYANSFDFSESVISVRTGGIIPRDHAINVSSPKNKKGHWKCLSIEEPFDLTNTARSVFDETIFGYIVDVFSRSCYLLDQTMDINRIVEISKLLEPRR